MHTGSGVKKTGKIMTISGVAVLIGSVAILGFTGSPQSAEDTLIEENLTKIAQQIDDSGPLYNGVSMQSLEQSDAFDFSMDSEYASLQASGDTDGYCLIGKSPNGYESRTGIVYASLDHEVRNGGYCIDGMFNDVPVDTRVTDMHRPAVGGEIPDSYPEKDSDTVFLDVMAFLGLSGSGPTIITGAILWAKPERRKRAGSELAVLQHVPDLDDLTTRYEAVRHEWASYELDPVKMLSLPLLSNMAHPACSDFHRTLRMASSFHPDNFKQMEGRHSTNPVGSIHKFEESVIELEHQFQVLISEAKRIQWTQLSDAEQSSLTRAQKLLNIALNEAAGHYERQIAYKRLLKEVQGIIVIPEQVSLAIEADIMKSIDAGDDILS